MLLLIMLDYKFLLRFLSPCLFPGFTLLITGSINTSTNTLIFYILPTQLQWEIFVASITKNKKQHQSYMYRHTILLNVRAHFKCKYCGYRAEKFCQLVEHAPQHGLQYTDTDHIMSI